VQVIIQVRPDTAQQLDQQRQKSASNAVLQAAEELGVVLAPVHSGTADLGLASYFVADVPDQATAERLISRLQQSGAIESVYLKPPDAMP
jgi:hypothetical protein